MKIITLCGSLKYMDIMMEVAERKAREGNCILTPVYPTGKLGKINEEEKKLFAEAHFKRIELSDAIYVINVDNYIGESTRSEIEFAKHLGKEIIYYQ